MNDNVESQEDSIHTKVGLANYAHTFSESTFFACPHGVFSVSPEDSSSFLLPHTC